MEGGGGEEEEKRGKQNLFLRNSLDMSEDRKIFDKMRFLLFHIYAIQDALILTNMRGYL